MGEFGDRAYQLTLRRWYFCINEVGFEDAWPLIVVAVRSCLANTELEPICLYAGDDAAQVRQIARLGVRVVRHRPRLEPALQKGYGDHYETFCGHWLRLDIPYVETEDEVVLYTDIDVLFRAHPRPVRRPRYLSAAPERYRWRWPHFNSGVMVLNLPRLRWIDARFMQAVERRMAKGWRPPGHDQISYNQVFRWRHGRLRHTLNWKPYWGWRSNAEIIHFHGPKPVHVDRLLAGDTQRMLPIYGSLWRQNPDAYARYAAEAAHFAG